MDKLKQAVAAGEIFPYRLSDTVVELRGSPEKLAALCEALIRDGWQVRARCGEIRIVFPTLCSDNEEDLPKN